MHLSWRAVWRPLWVVFSLDQELFLFGSDRLSHGEASLGVLFFGDVSQEQSIPEFLFFSSVSRGDISGVYFIFGILIIPLPVSVRVLQTL